MIFRAKHPAIAKTLGFIGLFLSFYFTFFILNTFIANFNILLVTYTVEALLLVSLYYLSIKMILRK